MKKYKKRIQRSIYCELILLFLFVCIFSYQKATGDTVYTASNSPEDSSGTKKESADNTADLAGSAGTTDTKTQDAQKDFIKWVDFKASYEALDAAYHYDVDTQSEPVHLNWIELLAYTAAKNGGDFPKSALKDMSALAEKLQNKEITMAEATKDMKYYNYYLEAYTAILGGFVGEYDIQQPSESDPSQLEWVKKYGLKAYHPIAKGFEYSDYDDFGVSRSYGYQRQHLGHDMMGQTGTPIIAVESGYVEALGWNQYGGWRLGIRSFDQKRYYYYAHLRQNFPYVKTLKEGSIVQAGDVIGYMGHTGYSTTENVNNIDTTHLHFGLQLIFDESQKEGASEIWVDCYSLVRFLYKNRSETTKDESTKEWFRIYEIKDPSVQEYASTHHPNASDTTKTTSN